MNRVGLRADHLFLILILCVRHLVPLTDLKPVNPVPAWNVAAPTRKGDLGMFKLGTVSVHLLHSPPVGLLYFHIHRESSKTLKMTTLPPESL